MATVKSTGLTAAQTKTLQGIVNSNPTYAQSYSTGNSVSAPQSGGVSQTASNPHDAPGYNPATDPTSSVYKANLANPQAPTNPAVPTDPLTTPTTPQTAPNNAQVAPPNATPDLASAIAGKGSALTSAEMANPQTLNDLASRYKQGLANAKAANPQTPTTQGQAMTGIQANMPGEQTENPALTNFFNPENPVIQDSTKQLMEWLNPEADRKMLNDSIKQLATDRAELGSMKTELMNVKRVMAGTEDDIRLEIQSAGGMGTESQVQALTIGRNKSLLAKAQLISDQIQSQTDLVNGDISLVGDEKQMAAQQFTQRMSLLNYQQENQKNIDNANRSNFQTLFTKVGANGLYTALSSDPKQLSSAEYYLGLGKGGLQKLATVPQLGDNQVIQLDNGQTVLIDKNTGNIVKNLGGAKPTGSVAPKVEKINGVDSQWNSSSGKWEPISMDNTASSGKQDALKQKVDVLSSIKSNPAIRSAVGPSWLGRFIGSGWDSQVTGQKQNFIGDVEQMISKEFLQNLIDVKAQGATFGALQKAEQDALTQSATKIGNWRISSGSGEDRKVTGYNASEKDFKKEIDKINGYSVKAFVVSGGNPDEVGAKLMPDGLYYVQNSDGSFYTFSK